MTTPHPARGAREVIAQRLRRARFAATPGYAWRTRTRTAFARTRVGHRLVRAVRDGPAGRSASLSAGMHAPRQILGHTGRNVLLVSHCDFAGNSAYHVYSIATELERRGWSPGIAVPARPGGVRDVGRPRFDVVSYRAATRGRVTFPDGRGPDLVHAFTPREPVRRLTFDLVRRHGCPYVVHLEDNEGAVDSAVPSTYDPAAMDAFLAGAAGVTVIVDRLLELKPEGVPAVVIWPGYDPALDEVERPRSAIREDIGLLDAAVAVAYTGSVHEANVDEVGALYEAVREARADGHDVVLVRSGLNSVVKTRLPTLGHGIRDLGWIRRRRVFELLHATDILVQPGAPGRFNDYRVPAKLPEFLASGHPVVLPRTNIGLHLEEGVEALLLESGDAGEIYDRMSRLLEDPDRWTTLGQAGRAFAARELQWSKSVDRLVTFYERLRADSAGTDGGRDGGI